MPSNNSRSIAQPEQAVWFWAAAPALAWAVHGLTSVFISWQACVDGDNDWGALSGAEVRWLMGAITLAMLAVAAAGLIGSLAKWRRLSGRSRLIGAEGRSHPEYVALGGTFIGTAFVVGIVWGGVPLAVLDACTRAR